MAWFGSQRENDPIQLLEADLKDKQARREQLIARLSAAELLIPEKRGAVELLAMTGSADAELDQAEGDVRAAEDRGRTLRGALAQLDQSIVGTERELSEAIEKRERDEVAAAVENMADQIAKALPTYLESAQRLSQTFIETPISTFESARIVEFLENSRRDVAAAIGIIHQDLVSKAKGVRAGTLAYGKQTVESQTARRQALMALEESTMATNV